MGTLRGRIRREVLDRMEALLPARLRLPFEFHRERILGRLEVELLRLDRLPLRPGVAVDVGANRGFYSYALSRRFPRVVSFEPNPSILEVLERHAAPNIQIHRVGLSSESSELELYVPIVDGVEHAGWASFDRGNLPAARDFRVIRVPVRTLDSFELENVSFLKVDVEGHEGRVLAGGLETLRRCRPVVLVEVRAVSRDQVFSLLEEMDYAPQRWDGPELRRVSAGEVPWCENLIFLPGVDAGTASGASSSRRLAGHG